MKPSTPVLVVRGRWPRGLGALTFAASVFLGLVVFANGVVFAAHALRDGLHALAPMPSFIMGVLVIAFALALWLSGVVSRDSWNVEFHEDEIRFKSGTGVWTNVVVPWHDIDWFSDARSHSVRLRLKGFVSSLIDLQIPTRTEETRTAVLHLLVSHGVARHE
jgi:hypothetical protein